MPVFERIIVRPVIALNPINNKTLPKIWKHYPCGRKWLIQGSGSGPFRYAPHQKHKTGDRFSGQTQREPIHY